MVYLIYKDFYIPLKFEADSQELFPLKLIFPQILVKSLKILTLPKLNQELLVNLYYH